MGMAILLVLVALSDLFVARFEVEPCLLTTFVFFAVWGAFVMRFDDAGFIDATVSGLLMTAAGFTGVLRW